MTCDRYGDLRHLLSGRPGRETGHPDQRVGTDVGGFELVFVDRTFLLAGGRKVENVGQHGGRCIG